MKKYLLALTMAAATAVVGALPAQADAFWSGPRERVIVIRHPAPVIIERPERRYIRPEYAAFWRAGGWFAWQEAHHRWEPWTHGAPRGWSREWHAPREASWHGPQKNRWEHPREARWEGPRGGHGDWRH